MRIACISITTLLAACNAVPAESTTDLASQANIHRIVVKPGSAASSNRNNAATSKDISASADVITLASNAPATKDIPQNSKLQIQKLPSTELEYTNVEEADSAIRGGFWIAQDPQQGAVINARAPSNSVSVTLDGINLPLSPDGFFLMGFDRDAASTAILLATLTNGEIVKKSLNVNQGSWKLERINAPYRAGRSSAAFTKLRGPEIAQIINARKIKTNAEGWRQDFIWPVKGRISGRFGSQRVYQGKPGSYHSGLDIAAPSGTAYVAPADGVVILASQKPFTLEGNLLMIDHGNGLNSAFLHSSSISVKLGDRVKQGQVIGRIGATGRATGPHLHWGMKWNAARTDPLLLLPQK